MKKELARLSKYGRRIRGPTINNIGKAERGEADERTVRRLVGRGLMEWTQGCGPPKLTPAGTAYIMADGLGARFFDICVLSAVYRFTRQETAQEPGPGKPRDRAAARVLAAIPLRTIQNHLMYWPYGDAEVGKSLSYLRAAGLLPRCTYKRVACNVDHLAGLHDGLVEIDKWIETTSIEMRRILVAPADSR